MTTRAEATTAALVLADLAPVLDALRSGDRATRAAAIERLRASDVRVGQDALGDALLDPDPEIARLARSALAVYEERLNREISVVREEMRRRPELPLVHAALGDRYVEYADLRTLDAATRRYYREHAVKAYARALKLSHERIGHLFVSIGTTLLALGRHKVALGFFDRAVAAAPDDGAPLVWRAAALAHLGGLERLPFDCAKALALGLKDLRLRAFAEFWAEARAAEATAEADRQALGEGVTPHGGVGRVVVTSATGRIAMDGTAADRPDEAAAPPPATGRALEEEVGEILGQLASPDAARRDEAFRRLLAYESDEAIDWVSRLLAGAPEVVRLGYCRWLGRVLSPLAIERLADLLDASEEAIRRAAAAALQRAPQAEKADALARCLETGSAFARAYAALAIAGADGAAPPDRRAVRALLANLDDPRHEVRETAIVALRRLGDRRALRPLARLTLDRRPEIRWQAVLALADLADRRSRRTLERSLEMDESARVRQAAAFALARSAGAGAADPLAQALARDGDSAVRQEAARRLGEVRGPGAGEALLRAAGADPSPSVRLAARLALDLLDAPSIYEPLARGLRDRDPRVRHAAAHKLGRLGDARAIGGLRDLCRSDPNADVRAGAAEALGRLAAVLPPPDAREIAPVLDAALGDEGEGVTAAAAVALGRVAGPADLDALAASVAGTPPPAPAETWSLRLQGILKLAEEAARREWIPDGLVDLARAGLKSENLNVCFLAAAALGRTGRRDAVEDLVAAGARAASQAAREAAAEAIARILDGDPFPLFERLEQGDLPVPQQGALLAAAAAMAVRPGLGPASVQRLLGLAPKLRERGVLPAAEREWLAFLRRAPRDVARQVASAAALKGGEDDQGLSRIAAEAARALGLLAAEGVPIPERGELREGLAAADAGVRAAAAEALGLLRDHESIAPLVTLAQKDRSPAVVAAARGAATRILRTGSGP